MDKKDLQRKETESRGRLIVVTSWVVSIFALFSLIVSMWIGGEGANSKLGYFIVGSITVLVFIVSSVILSIFWVASSHKMEDLIDRNMSCENDNRKLLELKDKLEAENRNLRGENDNLILYQRLWDDLKNRIGQKGAEAGSEMHKQDEIVLAFNRTRRELELADERRKLQDEKDQLAVRNEELKKENDKLNEEIRSLVSNIKKLDGDIGSLAGVVDDLKKKKQ